MSSSEEEEFTGDAEVEEFEAEDDEDEDDGDDGSDGSDEDDSKGEPLVALKNNSARKRSSSAPSYVEDDDESEESSSSDDDVPLSSLAAPKKKSAVKKPAANGKKKKATSPKKKKKMTSTSKKETAPIVTSSSGSSKNFEWASAALYGTSCDKGMLIQRLLCRWWYAYDWPQNIPNKPPTNYDALDGFPGVYICTAADAVGQIRDTRDAASAPTFQNFAKKSADELRDMLVTALNEQKKQLVEAEGSGAVAVKELDELLKWARKINTSKADKEAATILKSQGLKLP